MKIPKIAKIILFLIIAVIIVLLLLRSCRLAPFKEEWYFFSYREDVVFLNGVTLSMGFSDASHAYPFAEVKNQNIGISFTNDGKVEFTTKDGTTLYGTYTYENDGLTYTSFKITFENGETAEGSCMKSMGEKKLAFVYKETIYNFSDKNQRVNITTDDVIKRILNGDIDCLNESTVVKTPKGYSVRFSEMLSYPIEESTSVYAVWIHSDGTYEVLNELREGNVLSTYNNEADYVVIYYID